MLSLCCVQRRDSIMMAIASLPQFHKHLIYVLLYSNCTGSGQRILIWSTRSIPIRGGLGDRHLPPLVISLDLVALSRRLLLSAHSLTHSISA